MAHWLLKSEPDEWSWAEQAFFYHTGKEARSSASSG
jgi:predicted RNA-binding protein with PUA-like domain